MGYLLSSTRILFLSLMLVWLIPSGALAQEETFIEGKDYEEVFTPVPPKSGQPEVLEVFNFKCPHCANIHEDVVKWSQANAGKYTFKEIPIIWGNQTDAPVRAYFAARYLGHGNAMKGAIFHQGLEEKAIDMENPEELISLAEDLGMDPDLFAKTMSAFGVKMEAKRAQKLAQDLEVHSTPSFVVNGKYKLNVSMAGSLERLFAIVEWLAKK